MYLQSELDVYVLNVWFITISLFLFTSIEYKVLEIPTGFSHSWILYHKGQCNIALNLKPIYYTLYMKL